MGVINQIITGGTILYKLYKPTYFGRGIVPIPSNSYRSNISNCTFLGNIAGV